VQLLQDACADRVLNEAAEGVDTQDEELRRKGVALSFQICNFEKYGCAHSVIM
jgi:hypothetical protein